MVENGGQHELAHCLFATEQLPVTLAQAALILFEMFYHPVDQNKDHLMISTHGYHKKFDFRFFFRFLHCSPYVLVVMLIFACVVSTSDHDFPEPLSSAGPVNSKLNSGRSEPVHI